MVTVFFFRGGGAEVGLKYGGGLVGPGGGGGGG